VNEDVPQQPRLAVSIIITTFDRADLVPRAIDSVLGQTYPNIEIVVVDDGSTDATREVLARYAETPRVRLIFHDRNHGVTAAKNTGLSALRDPCALFGMVDSDDILCPNAVETIAGVFDATGTRYSMVFGWGRSIGTHAPTGQMTHLPKGFGEVTFDDALDGRFRGDFWHLARRDLLGSMRFEERATGGEGSIWWRLLRASPGWLVSDVVLDVDTSGSDRLSVPDYSREAAGGMMWSQQAMLDAVGADLRRRNPRTYARWLAELAKWAALAGDGRRARLSSRRAVRLAPTHRAVVMAILAIAPRVVVVQIAELLARIRVRKK
jgi:hypothetical protein